jgi:hypothetical protein
MHFSFRSVGLIKLLQFDTRDISTSFIFLSKIHLLKIMWLTNIDYIESVHARGDRNKIKKKKKKKKKKK